MRPDIPPRAYHGARGWAYAKLVAPKRPLIALLLYINALRRGCYRPSLACIVLLQIFLGKRGYRRLADQAISWLRIGIGEREEKTPAGKLERA